MTTNLKYYVFYILCFLQIICLGQENITLNFNINDTESISDIIFANENKTLSNDTVLINTNSENIKIHLVLLNKKIVPKLDSIHININTLNIDTTISITSGNLLYDLEIEKKAFKKSKNVSIVKTTLYMKNKSEITKPLTIVWESNNHSSTFKKVHFSNSQFTISNSIEQNFGENEDLYKKLKGKIVYHYYHGSIADRGYYKTYLNKNGNLVCDPVSFNDEKLNDNSSIMFKIHNVNRYLYDISIDKQLITYGSELNTNFANLIFGGNVNNVSALIENEGNTTNNNLNTFKANYYTLYNHWQNDLYLKTKPESLEKRINNINLVKEQRDYLVLELGNLKTKSDTAIMNALPKPELFTEMKTFYAEFEDNFSYTINHVNLRKGNQINLDIKITPKKIGGLNTENKDSKLFRDSIGFEDHINLPIVSKFFFSFSTGTYITLGNQLREVEYKWVNIPDFNGGFTDKYQLIQNKITQNYTGISAYVNGQYRCSENFGAGFSFGVGIKNHQLSNLSNNFEPTYLLGGALFFGSDRQFVLTLGMAWTKLNVLNPEFKYLYDNQIILDDISSVDVSGAYHKQTKAGWFIALSYTPFKHYKVKKGRVESPKDENDNNGKAKTKVINKGETITSVTNPKS